MQFPYLAVNRGQASDLVIAVDGRDSGAIPVPNQCVSALLVAPTIQTSFSATAATPEELALLVGARDARSEVSLIEVLLTE